MESLGLNGAIKITDAGLQKLHGLKKLKTLGLEKTRVSDKAIAELQRALPECHVMRWGENSARESTVKEVK